MPANVAPDLQGRILAGRYRISRLLARGGMAEVWTGLDEVLNRPVAVKVLKAELAADQSFVERFRREAIAAARLNHPSIVAIYDTCSEGGVEAIVMELAPGQNLRTVLDEKGTFSAAEVVTFGAQAAAALEVAHAARLIHRDIKPANILIVDSGDGDGRRAMITDFGIAKVEGSSDLTTIGSVMGTAKYLAPEQIEGKAISPRTDVYALGAVLYEALCGRPPFQEDSDLATALARVRQAPLSPRQIRADVPRALDAALMRALAREPQDRFASAAQFRAALLASRGAESTQLISLPAPNDRANDDTPTATFVATERSWLVPAGALLALAGLLVLAAVLLRETSASQNLFRAIRGDQVTKAAATTATTATVAAPLKTVRLTSFDPFDTDGDGEHDNELPLLIDGDPTSGWTTQAYRDNLAPNWKTGVGVVFTLEKSTSLSELTLTSPMLGWTVEVYVAENEPSLRKDLRGWGDIVTSGTATTTDKHRFDLGQHQGRYVLVWITKLAGDGQFRDGNYGVTWLEAELRA